ncbi:MAG TPA: aminotransferase class III-fold pyridoxal phosphate-dependent enzyme, partial [Kofleriaceae bacterium]|nr:aminotransferase class III-fold pyridoxal phosphate-dependent enzyme [Kofleriaceae bacterium]
VRALPEAQSRRARLIGPSVRLAYRRPLRLARGWRQYLYDDDGRRYLDAYNNVPHVGHCHPRVVEAAAHQMSVLNTNTRYLQDVVDDYAERLTATLPEPLRLCFFVSSASEANELAIRLARAYTERRDLLVLDAAYHGNTSTLIDISPYKHAGPGGLGPPDWVHTAPIADDYRGPYRRGARDAGARYAADAARAVAAIGARGRALAGFIAESCPSVGGQIVFPDGYLAGVYEAVRGAGGVCIADEVQTGLGRIGTHMWAFEAQGVVPDIVVMGKPLGNGHPLAAVVTTRAIADAFDSGMEYFSTFGGNTVSCAVGLAVLDVLRDEALQVHAHRVGAELLAALRGLAARHELIGDVRGSGLFLGVELVADRATLAPAAAEASYVVNRMRDRGVLIGSDGPHHNVLQIRPPMPFDAGDGARLVDALDRVLGELT